MYYLRQRLANDRLCWWLGLAAEHRNTDRLPQYLSSVTNYTVIVIMLTQEYLRSILDYNPETGVFTWLNRPDVPSWWNSRWAGTKAGVVRANGYVVITINKEQLLAHRLVFIYMDGVEPNVVDHINSIKTDNRFCNLRNLSDNHKNQMNQKKYKTNKSGYSGVSFENGKWRARIKFKGVSYCGGRHETMQQAIKARETLKEKYGFHSQHGIKKGA